MNVSYVQAMIIGAIVTLTPMHGATAAPPAVLSAPLPERNFPTEKELAKFLEPLPPPNIPDNPPPHEGAMIDYPQTVGPPDLILVEVLEALPGRPISGERLVRPDGVVSLGFYGDVYVRGLTPEQIKVKIILHLRTWLPDEVLGLYRVVGVEMPAAAPDANKGDAVKPERGENDFDLSPKALGTTSARRSPRAMTSRRARSISQRPGDDARRGLTAPRDEREPNVGFQGAPPPAVNQAAPKPSPGEPPAPVGPGGGMGWHAIHPADSDRVFVDITSYNHNNYFVLGDVAAPGRLPFTGNETVLDAMNYAGGMVATAEPKNIRLVRPSTGGRAERTYRVDWAAILAGDSRANYQVLPGDRIIVGRNDVVQKTIELDRLTASFSNVIDSMHRYNSMIGSVKQLGDPSKGAAAISADQREAIMKAWVDFWAKAMSQPGGVTLDEKTLREALLKALVPDPSAKPDHKE